MLMPGGFAAPAYHRMRPGRRGESGGTRDERRKAHSRICGRESAVAGIAAPGVALTP